MNRREFDPYLSRGGAGVEGGEGRGGGGGEGGGAGEGLEKSRNGWEHMDGLIPRCGPAIKKNVFSSKNVENIFHEDRLAPGYLDEKME